MKATCLSARCLQRWAGPLVSSALYADAVTESTGVNVEICIKGEVERASKPHTTRLLRAPIGGRVERTVLVQDCSPGSGLPGASEDAGIPTSTGVEMTGFTAISGRIVLAPRTRRAGRQTPLFKGWESSLTLPLD